jgi:hypothetical protein
MSQRLRHLPSRAFFIGLLLLAALCAGCGDDGGTADPGKLCRTGAGFGARIAGMPRPVDMCVANDRATALLDNGSPARFDLVAVFTTADSITIEINISFFSHTDLPQSLIITNDPNLPGVDDVWFFYRETLPGTYDYSSLSISGSFTLTFADPTVVVATFSSLQISLEDAGGTPVGARMISEGFLALTPDNQPAP